MNKKSVLLVAIMVAFVLTAGTYAYTYGLTDSLTFNNVTDAGRNLAVIEPPSYQPDWYAVTARLQGDEEEDDDGKDKGNKVKIAGEVPTGDLFIVNTHPEYPGDLLVRVYLTNTGDLIKAYQYLNMKLYVAGSSEAYTEPFYVLLSLENGEASFNLEGGSGTSPAISLVGGSYHLQSSKPDKWEEGWTVVPEFYAEVTPR